MTDAHERSLPRVIIETSVALTLLGGVAVLLRLAAVARGDLNLAFAIARVSNFPEILLSTLLLVAPVLTLVALGIVLTWGFPVVHEWLRRPNLPGFGRAVGALSLVAGTTVVAIVFQTSELPLMIAVFVYIGVIAFWRTWPGWVESRLPKPSINPVNGLTPKRPRPPKGFAVDMGVSMGAVVTVSVAIGVSTILVASLIPNDAAWSATEVLTFDDQPPYVGRVISTDETWTYIIIDDPREMRIVATTAIASRTFCDYGPLSVFQDQLWVSNLFGVVSLRPTYCQGELDTQLYYYYGHTEP